MARCSPKYLLAIILVLVMVISCTPRPKPESPQDQTPTPVPTAIASPEFSLELPTPTTEDNLFQEAESYVALTHQRLDGNRLLVGSGAMPTEPLDIQLSGKLLWVTAAPVQDNSVWVVVLESGQVQAFQIEDREVSELTLNVLTLPPGMPPVLQVVGNRVELLSPFPDASEYTNPILLEDGIQAYINMDGQLRLISADDTYTLEVNSLPDARILSDGSGRLLFLSAPTERYPHGVLGDLLEATTITLVDTKADSHEIRKIWIDPGDVIEGIIPIWVDLDGDEEREIIVTQSNADTGARIVVYREDGSLFASGEPIGQGFRWRHQLAIGQFIEGGTQEIAVIRTPHIGGVIELYGLEGDRLEIKTVLSGFSSHQIGSRNLDSALAGDFNGDGKIEIVLPGQSQTTLAGIQSIDNDWQIVWRAPLGGQLSTNLAAVTLSNDRLALGVGTSNDILRVWNPKQ